MSRFTAFSLLSITFLCLLILFVFLQIPNEKTLRGCLTAEMFQVELCPGSKNYTPLSKISKYLLKTVVLTEDSNFYQHEGFDWNSLEKVAKENLKAGEIKRGGSTISQQLAKNLFLNKDKTFSRKFFEFLITMKIESSLNKREILERYLNVVEFGKKIYGIRAASQFYFQKSAADLSVVESAFLAALLPNPVKYSQSFYKKELSPFMRNRMSKIIRDLYQYERITLEEAHAATVEFRNFLNPNHVATGLTFTDDLEVGDELEPEEDLEFSEEEI